MINKIKNTRQRKIFRENGIVCIIKKGENDDNAHKASVKYFWNLYTVYAKTTNPEKT